jgi:hypothetical protein
VARHPTIDSQQTLTNHTNFGPPARATGITQAMVNPKRLTRRRASITADHAALHHHRPSDARAANTAFLKGGADGPNATAVSSACTFWLETLQGQSAPTQLQYTQTVLLNFNGISWPHVTVGTLHKA